MEFNQELSDFLSNAPLYKKFETEILFTSPYDFEDFGIKIFCQREKDYTTHTLSIHPEGAKKYIGNLAATAWGVLGLKPETLPFTQHYQGLCNSCKKHVFNVLIEVKKFKKTETNGKPESTITKIGQYPPNSILPHKTLVKYLKPDQLELYKKALLNLSQGYGIGAYAYFRRVTENLLLTLLRDISELDYKESAGIKKLITQHEQNHDMASLVDSVFLFLPDSLKILGNNPIKHLYVELSVGLHQLEEKECLERAKSLDMILTFVIKKILEERNEISSIRKLINNVGPKTD